MSQDAAGKTFNHYHLSKCTIKSAENRNNARASIRYKQIQLFMIINCRIYRSDDKSMSRVSLHSYQSNIEVIFMNA